MTSDMSYNYQMQNTKRLMNSTFYEFINPAKEADIEIDGHWDTIRRVFKSDSVAFTHFSSASK